MQQAGVTPDIRPVVAAANEAAQRTGEPAMAIQLPDGEMVIGKTSELMGCSAAALLNALKALAGAGGHGVHLIKQSAIEPIQTVKVKYLGSNNPRLHSDEVLVALAASANQDALPCVLWRHSTAVRLTVLSSSRLRMRVPIKSWVSSSPASLGIRPTTCITDKRRFYEKHYDAPLEKISSPGARFFLLRGT